jgi:hypothetical protein
LIDCAQTGCLLLCPSVLTNAIYAPQSSQLGAPLQIASYRTEWEQGASWMSTTLVVEQIPQDMEADEYHELFKAQLDRMGIEVLRHTHTPPYTPPHCLRMYLVTDW